MLQQHLLLSKSNLNNINSLKNKLRPLLKSKLRFLSKSRQFRTNNQLHKTIFKPLLNISQLLINKLMLLLNNRLIIILKKFCLNRLIINTQYQPNLNPQLHISINRQLKLNININRQLNININKLHQANHLSIVTPMDLNLFPVNFQNKHL